MVERKINLDKIQSYEFVKREEIEELNTTGYLLKHKKSGARVVLMMNEDKNKVFNIGFRTPPKDDTGVPHIIEHTVLCGSRKYPPKDPFVELVKGSLNTFLNAMTYPDKTIFPVASCNEKDFRNLVNVYMDAVLYPNIYKKEEIFRQEGWSYELEEADGNLIYNGVVYNEMKGALSTPDSILGRSISAELFPDTCYRYESGGDPEFIPDLTYEEFLDFHRTYYHPSNSYIYLYGDMDMEEYLNWLDEEYLKDFDEIEVDSEIQYQKPFDSVKHVEKEYPLGEEEDAKGKYIYSYATTAGDALNQLDYYGMKILDYAIISMPGAPLRKALTDAGIGKEVNGGFSSGSLQNEFCVITKEADEGKEADFVKVIDETLEKLVKDGVDKDSLKAALNVFEFQYREADFGSYPKGLFYCMDMFESWLYDENEPFMHIKAGATFARLKELVETGYYEELIEKYLFKNNHKVILTMVPVKGLSKIQEQKVEEKLADYKSKLSSEEILRLVADTEALKKYQSEPSSEEELNTIPLLQLEDIEKYPEKFVIDERKIDDVDIVFSEVPSNGIAYINFAFDAGNVPQELIPYTAIMKMILADIDTEKHSYVELNNLINMHSGGFHNEFSIYGLKNGGTRMMFENYIKVFYSEMKAAFDIVEEILMLTKYDDTKRLYEIIAEQKSKMRARLMSKGHSTAVCRANAYQSEAGYIADLTSGIGYYRFLDDIEKNYEERKEEVVLNLKKLAKLLFVKENLTLSFTAEETGYTCMCKEFSGFVNNLYPSQESTGDRKIKPEKLNEAFRIPANISYVARVGNFKRAGFEYNGAMDTLRNILDYDYLWNNVRVKGGAYGVMSSYGATSGNVAFVSYRDPNVKRTNDIFDGIPEYLRNFEADDRELLKYIIGTISGKDTPKTPRTQGKRSFAAYLSQISYEDICKEREEILTLSVDKVRSLAPIMEAVLSQNYVCVVGNAEKIEESKELFETTKELFE